MEDMDILRVGTICYSCSEKAETLHNSIPLCRKCDCRVRKHMGLELMPKKYYKTEKQIKEEYELYWKSIRAEKEKIKNESRKRTKHLKKDYCEKCGKNEKLEFHHFDYIKDKGETLCFDCHKEEQLFVIEKNKAYFSDVAKQRIEDKELAKQRIRDKELAKQKIRDKERENKKAREDTLKLVKKCFGCGIETTSKRDKIPICKKCNNKIERKLWKTKK